MKFTKGCLILILHIIIVSAGREKPFKLSIQRSSGPVATFVYINASRNTTYRVAGK